MPSNRRKPAKVVERPKTRKEQRKDKRLQKKANRVHYHKKKKELKIEYRERLKQKKDGKAVETKAERNEDIIHGAMQTKGDEDDNDEEIESDFELSDTEMEEKFQGTNSATSSKSRPTEPDRFQQDLQKEKQKQKQLEKEMKKQRVRQLKAANEDEDKMIRKLEKQLKIDKKRTANRVPKMFNDGLEYALELCLPQNIQKMYTAAKEAAEQDEDSDSGFQEDMAAATGKTAMSKRKEDVSAVVSKKTLGKKNAAVVVVDAKAAEKMAKLRMVESKYFGTDDELDSDLSGADSEYEQASSDDEVVEVHNKDKKKKQHEQAAKDSDDSEFDIEDDDDDDDDDEDEDDFDDIGDKDDDEDGSDDFELADGDVLTEIGKKKEILDDDIGDSEEFGASDMEDSDDEPPSKSKKKTGDWEDIYGRNRDKDGNVIMDQSGCKAEAGTKYVAPHIRARLAAAAAVGTTDADEPDPKRREKLQRLKKQLKGYTNRLSEANMHKIASDIEAVYMQNSRYDANNTLTELVLEALVSNVLAPERLVMEHTMLIAVLHANVGSEVGAHFLQKFIERFDQMIGHVQTYDVENKELDNVIFVICHMYTFKIFHHNLIYEILTKLTDPLCEKAVECILLALRSIGFSLRKDDPMALKELIAVLQKKSNEASDEFRNNIRLKYMLDVVLAIKNNNVNKIPQYDPSLAEHLRKILRGMLVNGKYVTTLNITLDDLLRADQRGKWWVVGSAWTGNVSDIGAASSGKTAQQHSEATKFSATILELAKRQRMNTDDRKNVFCILMTAEDYIEAFEKLHHLSIKDHKVIVTVIIHCCLSEKVFNPYYAVLMEKFCDFDRKYQLAVQFAIWDRIKDIGASTSVQTRNLAQFVIHLVQHGGLALSVLKIIEFGELDKATLRLVRQIVLGILMGTEVTCKQVFQRIAAGAKLKGFKDSIRLFMHHFLIKGGSKSGITDDQMSMLRQRIQIADKALETLDSRVQF